MVIKNAIGSVEKKWEDLPFRRVFVILGADNEYVEGMREWRHDPRQFFYRPILFNVKSVTFAQNFRKTWFP